MVRPSSSHDKDAAHNTLSSAFASMMAVGVPQFSHNTFGIGPLRIDDSSSSRSGRKSRSGAATPDEGRSRQKEKKLGGLRRAGRSMSPFRFGSQKRSSSASRVKSDGTEVSDSEHVGRIEKDSDTESVVSSASGIIPRNSAFHIYDDDDPRHPANHAHQSFRVDSPGMDSPPSSLMPPAPSIRSGAPTSPLSEDGPGADADVESIASDDSDDDQEHPGSFAAEDEDEEEEDIDPIVLDNTLYNAEFLTAHTKWGPDVKSDDGSHHFETYEDEDLERDDEHITAPNVVLPESQAAPYQQRFGASVLALSHSRPRFERNRCTIILNHGDADAAAKNSKRPKRYVVASDGSEESSYAVEWTIGTVLRDGDEMLVVSVMETDAKLDALDPKHEEVSARLEHQRIRQAMASVLAKQATHLLERTRLEVRISCQAIHAKNSRHMLLDLIDFYEPTMVIVGSRGLGSLRGILLGSTSHYLLQKSSAPVMVVRKRLKLPALPRGKGDVVESVRARHMRLDEALIDKSSNANEEAQAKEASAKEPTDETPQSEDVSPSDEAVRSEVAETSVDAKAASDDGKATPTEPVDSSSTSPGETSSKLIRKPSKSGTSSGPTVIPHTSLEREAETRTEIKQRKVEAAKLHEDEKKQHASGQIKLRPTDVDDSDDENESEQRETTAQLSKEKHPAGMEQDPRKKAQTSSKTS